jgi:outer membrane protein, heavy metal efflux system
MPVGPKTEGGSVVQVLAKLGPAQAVNDTGPFSEHEHDATNLRELWRLAEANNPSLREATADVEIARGQQKQAGRYPNPRFVFSNDLIGSRAAPSGNMSWQINQEIVMGGKRRLDVAIAGRETSAADLGLMSQRFAVMTRLRRVYYAYLGALATVQLHEAADLALQKGLDTTRKLVEEVQTRPRTDLLRLEALLEETKIDLARSQFNVQAAWKQVAAEVGVSDLPMPKDVGSYPPAIPQWEADKIWERVKSANTQLQQAQVEVERARLAVDRARVEAIPNITVGGGYANAPIESTAGAVVTLEAPLPVWDLKKGHVQAAQALLVKTQAAVSTLEANLAAATAEAWARYQGANRQVEKLSREVLPRLQESVDLLLKGYEAGGANVTFTDVLTTEQSLIDTRLKLAEARLSLWQAAADLQGLMQLEISDN